MMMAGSLHPPCRRKKFRSVPSPPDGEDSTRSIPSSSPHRAGRGGGPWFPSRRKRENGPCTVQKRKGSMPPRGDQRRRDAQGVPPFFTQVFGPRRGASGGFGSRCMDYPSILAAANLALASFARSRITSCSLCITALLGLYIAYIVSYIARL